MVAKKSHRLESVALPSPVPGTGQVVNFHHYGEPGSRPKAYLQAALHADETPGLLVLHKLLGMLDAADARNEIVGHIVVAPFANPIGLNQFLLGTQQGRYYAENGKNYNRDFPDISDAVAEKIEGQLSTEPDHNVQLIRAACVEVMAAMAPCTPLDTLRHALLSRSIDADYVFDLHCDFEAILYMFVLPELWPNASDLAAYLGCRSVLLAEPSPGDPFDEVNGALWSRLAKKFPDAPIGNACMATTIELRGKTDVSESVAERDAGALFAYLQSRGLLGGEVAPIPEPQCVPTPFDGVGRVVAPHSGVVSFCREPGDHVEKGEQVATLFRLDKDSLPTPLFAPVSGCLFSRRAERYTLQGMELCDIAGKQSLPENAGVNLLSD